MEEFKKGLTLFSSEGELKDVENARLGVGRSLPSLGIKTEKGIVLATITKQSESELLEEDIVGSAYKIGDKVGMVSSGRVADAQGIAEDMRDMAVEDIERYGRVEDVRTICKGVAEEVRDATQRIVERPYGVSLIVGGIDGHGVPSLYRIEVDGKISQWSAVAMGQNEDEIMEYLKDSYESDMSIKKSVLVSYEALGLGVDGDIELENFSAVKMTDEGLESVKQSEIQNIQGDQNE